MPDHDDDNAFRQRLCDRLAALGAQNTVNADARNTVVLDQSSVGRLSRMDALQQQAMAKATAQNTAQEIRAIHAALARLDAGEYGYCSDCGEEIARKRLALAPTATKCIGCAGG